MICRKINNCGYYEVHSEKRSYFVMAGGPFNLIDTIPKEGEKSKWYKVVYDVNDEQDVIKIIQEIEKENINGK